MSGFIRCKITTAIFLVILFLSISAFTLIACDNETSSSFSSKTYSTVSNSNPTSTTSQKPTGVAGSTLLPENAPEAKHFIGGGGCFEHHEIPTTHDGEILNESACDRCHTQTSTTMPASPTLTNQK